MTIDVDAWVLSCISIEGYWIAEDGFRNVVRELDAEIEKVDTGNALRGSRTSAVQRERGRKPAKRGRITMCDIYLYFIFTGFRGIERDLKKKR